MHDYIQITGDVLSVTASLLSLAIAARGREARTKTGPRDAKEVAYRIAVIRRFWSVPKGRCPLAPKRYGERHHTDGEQRGQDA